ncbi:MAG: hypothetical protein IPJ65_11545 [Archangiaceae bacterium]|nr:hypothetical protein [Archangiaceae bacterium]
MTTLLLLAVLQASASPPSLAAPGFSKLNVTDQQAAFFAEHFAQQLSQRGCKVTSSAQIAAVLGLERQKQLLGCADESSSCNIELANALGADGIVVGEVARFEGRYQLNVKVTSAKDGSVLASASFKAKDEEEALDGLSAAARRMAPEVAERLGRTLEKPSGVALAFDNEQNAKTRRWALVPLALAVVSAGVAVGLYVVARGDFDRLNRGTFTVAEGGRIRDEGKTLQLVSAVGVGVSVAALAAAAAVFFLNRDTAPSVTPSVSVSGSGAAAVLTGSF